MSRTSAHKLPQIAVEERAVRTRVDLPATVEADLERYARYFAASTGRTPLTAGHVIVGLLQTYLAESADFQKWKREGGNHAASDASPFAQDVSGRPRMAFVEKP